MKYALLIVLLITSASLSLAYELQWGTGKGDTNRLKLDGSFSTAATFTNNYELRLMYIGKTPSLTSRGYATFLLTDTGVHNPTAVGTIQHTAIIPGGTELNNRKLLPVLYEKATKKYFYLSTSLNGGAINPHTLSGIMGDGTDFPGEYYPISPTSIFYKGAEIPPFCGWLSNYGLTETNLTGILTNKVNLAFAVNANPTNFNGTVTMSVTNFVIGTSSINGKFSAVSYNAQNTPSPVSKFNGTNTLSLVAAPTLSGITNAVSGASVNVTNKTFQVTRGATNTTEFFRLKLNVPAVW